MTTSRSVATILRKARESAGLSQAELARRIGVPRQRINQWESGRTIPRADTYVLILTACQNKEPP